jgi:charged multivesicular body protein 2A
MKTQLQGVSLRIQTVRSNQQMMQSMKGATRLLGSMNRSMNLPALQRIAMEFEKENDIMDQRQEMMEDAIDDSMEADEEESEEIVNQVLDEIGIDLNQKVRIDGCSLKVVLRSAQGPCLVDLGLNSVPFINRAFAILLTAAW